MKKVFFEIGGHKMAMEVNSNTDAEAKEIVKNKIIFHKIEEKKDEDIENILKNILSVIK